ncbi:MAG: hypothetical protein HY590_02240 [Candidatus Omnitrophica bacterium]|nr:hypothetical protein [Candidatus Omnitrophota bacterium]
MTLPEARTPFQFYTRLSLCELTGLRAVTLSQLLKFLQTLPGSVIFHHTHHYLQEHQYLTPEPPNDFASWVGEVLGEKKLGEELAGVNTVAFPTIRALRERLIGSIERSLRAHPFSYLRFAKPEEAFHFVKSVSVILPTPYRAKDLKEFAECVEATTLDSLYFHLFEARLRLERGRNDFSAWLEEDLSEAASAQAIASLDPYTHTMEELRQIILRLLHRRLEAFQGAVVQ